ATWSYGGEKVAGLPHIVWHRIGTHDILTGPWPKALLRGRSTGWLADRPDDQEGTPTRSGDSASAGGERCPAVGRTVRDPGAVVVPGSRICEAARRWCSTDHESRFSYAYEPGPAFRSVGGPGPCRAAPVGWSSPKSPPPGSRSSRIGCGLAGRSAGRPCLRLVGTQARAERAAGGGCRGRVRTKNSTAAQLVKIGKANSGEVGEQVSLSGPDRRGSGPGTENAACSHGGDRTAAEATRATAARGQAT
ncbi:hypothetical protein CD790_30625, partial [Streptomyces sp. SAJ15]